MTFTESEPRAARQHRITLLFAFAVTTNLVVVTAETRGAGNLLIAAALSLAPALLALLLTPRRPDWLATGAILTFAIQATVATLEFGPTVHADALMIASVAVVASYRVLAPLFLATAVVAVFQVTMVLIGDTSSGAMASTEAEPAEAVLFIATAAALGGWALFTLWNDHRRAEALAAIENQLSRTYREVMPLVSVRLDTTGAIMDANRRACMMLDREIEDIVGRNWFELALTPEDCARAKEDYAAILAPTYGDIRPMQSYVNEVVAADGVRRSVEWYAGVVTNADGTTNSLLCIGRDITDERAAKAEAARARAEIDAFRRLAQKIASLDDARQAVVDATLELCGAASVGISEPDRQRQTLTVETCTEPKAVGVRIDLASEASGIGQAFLSGRTIQIDDIATDPGSHARLKEIIGPSEVAHQPIVGAGGVLGVLSVAWTAPRDRDERDHAMQLLRLLSHEAAVALRRRESLAALERAALIDPLTSVSNRRAFDAELPAALRRAADSGKPFTLLLADLNHFKQVNDELGHEAGDALLIACASAWADVLRAGDVLARIGGDEFAVLLPSCDEVEAMHIVERLRAATPHEPGSSLGTATWDGVESPSQLVRRADEAQYRDKARGRASGDPAARGGRSAIDPARDRPADPRS